MKLSVYNSNADAFSHSPVSILTAPVILKKEKVKCTTTYSIIQIKCLCHYIEELRKQIAGNSKDCQFNPFVPIARFFYPLKTSENLTMFWCFQGVEKGCISNEWTKFVKAYWNGKFSLREVIAAIENHWWN